MRGFQNVHRRGQRSDGWLPEAGLGREKWVQGVERCELPVLRETRPGDATYSVVTYGVTTVKNTICLKVA